MHTCYIHHIQSYNAVICIYSAIDNQYVTYCIYTMIIFYKLKATYNQGRAISTNKGSVPIVQLLIQKLPLIL